MLHFSSGKLSRCPSLFPGGPRGQANTELTTTRLSPTPVSKNRHAKQAPVPEAVLTGTIHRHNVEDAATALSSHFDLEIQQLRPGQYKGKMDFIAAGTSIVYRENFPQDTTILGSLRGSRFGIGLPLDGASQFSGRQTSGDLIPSAISGEQIDYMAHGGSSHLIILVDHARLCETAEACRVTPAALRALSGQRDSMPMMTSPHAVAVVKRTFGKMLDQAVRGTFEARPQNFENLVLEALLSLVDHLDEPYGRPPASVLFRRARQLADEMDRPANIAMLAATLRVSSGTLQKAFISATGLTPKKYLLHRQLNRARQALLAADPFGSDSVTSVALGLGFTELGRFAVRYRQFFGESPSQTLHRRTRTTVALPGGGGSRLPALRGFAGRLAR
jgi:AraC-like DNA-binding protein